jgi:hypothetical protein
MLIIRQSPGFLLVKNNMIGNLPVNDPEFITCWENLEYSILKLEEEQFNILLNDRKQRIKNKTDTKKINKVNTTTTTPLVNNNNTSKKLIKPQIENDFVAEMERMFESGDQKSVIEVLKSYEK